ncbi:MAG: class I SAM-dependent methyltransferase [Candidatus Omnitrophica bacterium]|nr:class I SAM-dependent methyltransferase [Candidatus Omnitrophota bacterium]
MSCSTKLKTLSRLIKAIAKQPKASRKLLAHLITTIQGFRYAKDWLTSNTDNISPSLLNAGESLEATNPLKSYINNYKGEKGICKPIHYFDIYHRCFKKFIGRETHILEVGVYSGGSLEMWRSYFGSNCHVYGIDIEEKCKLFENDYTKIFIGDQGDRQFWKQFKEKVAKIDIIIDDGSHLAEDQIITLEEMLPHLSPGGVYLCEDIADTHSKLVAYLYGMINGLNEWGLPEPDKEGTQFQKWVKTIQFFPWVAVVEKEEKAEQRFTMQRLGTKWLW